MPRENTSSAFFFTSQSKGPILLQQCVSTPAALALPDFIDVEVTPLPKGQIAIATSWSQPESSYAVGPILGPTNAADRSVFSWIWHRNAG
jgi:hypothetical protein